MTTGGTEVADTEIAGSGAEAMIDSGDIFGDFVMKEYLRYHYSKTVALSFKYSIITSLLYCYEDFYAVKCVYI